MIYRTTFLFVVAITATAVLLPSAGCSHQPTDTNKADDKPHGDHAHNEHGKDDSDGHHEGHGHAPLTEQSVKMPESFAAGVSRLTELHARIDHLIEHDELADVHAVAEEMAIVARKMKELAAQDVAEDKRADAGRLCNEIAGYFRPIDEAADAGKKDDTIALHEQMATTISKLASLYR